MSLPKHRLRLAHIDNSGHDITIHMKGPDQDTYQRELVAKTMKFLDAVFNGAKLSTKH